MNSTIWRGIAVWLAATTGSATVGWWALSAPTSPTSTESFEGLLARGAALALAACAGWAWLVTTTVLVAAAAGASRAPGVPAWARRAVLAACGLALAGVVAPGVASASYPTPTPADPVAGALAGLQLPDRTTGPAHDAAGLDAAWLADRAAGPPLTVRPGDSLWRLAADLLPAGATATEVAALSDRLYALNRAVIGDDPDLITPGQLLRTPPGLRTDR